VDAREEQLLCAIRETPDDDAARLVYADYLTERGDLRGELIAVQCALSRHDGQPPPFALVERERELLQDLAPYLRSFDVGTPLVRGFFSPPDEDLHVTAQELIANADDWFRVAPSVTALVIPNPGRDTANLTQLPALTRYRRLRLALPRGALFLLSRSPHLVHLEELDLRDSGIDDEGLGAIALSANLPRLRRLNIAQNRFLTPSGLVALCTSPLAARLEELNLSRLPCADAAVRSLRSAPLPELKVLDLSECQSLSAETLGIVSEGAPRLERLAVRRGNISAPGVTRISAASALVDLDLYYNEFGDDGVDALLRSEHLGRLERLNVSVCGIGPDAATRLLRMAQLPNMSDLALNGAIVRVAGIEALVASGRRLRRLELQNTQLDDAGLATLVGSQAVGALGYLNLGNNGLGDRAARALLDSPCLRSDCRIHYFGNETSQSMRERLKLRFPNLSFEW
jgi:uncharacterized protein (TIGR02996 family)